MADDSDSSGLSEHSDKEIQKLAPIFARAKKATKTAAPPPALSPPRPKRSPSPPHQESLADNAHIAFIVMFRSRFSDCLPAKLAHFGPHDLERGVTDSPPSPQVEHLLCALLGLVLNRKKPVERGHHGRALEEAVQTQKPQWPHSWRGANPLHGGKSFENQDALYRLDLLRTLIMWSLTASEAVQTTIKQKYKQQRNTDDENQPLSVQPWGVDGDKRRYFLIQGLDDTSFRVYREGSRYTKNAHWYNQAGNIEEVRDLSKKLEDKDGSQAARRLAGRMNNAIPMFEATEEKRRRREYRQVRKAAFSRPEPGFSLYEGRTRGKRMRYTLDDEDEDEDDDDAFTEDTASTRRSARQSARTTPFEPPGPTFTASGRQINKPKKGEYGESLLSGPPMSVDDVGGAGGAEGVTREGTQDSEAPVRGRGRAARGAANANGNGNGASNPRKRKLGAGDSEAEADASEDDEDGSASAGGWDSERNGEGDEEMPDAADEDEEDSDVEQEEEVGVDEVDELAADEEPQSRVVKLKVSPERVRREDAASAAVTAEAAAAAAAETATKAAKAADTNGRHAESESNGAIDCEPSKSANGVAAPSAYPTPTSQLLSSGEQKKAAGTVNGVVGEAAAAATTVRAEEAKDEGGVVGV